MSGFAVAVEARHVVNTVYEVFCNRCRESIGTMTFSMIREAMWATLGRGGVLCPDCRKATCDGCGRLDRNEPPRLEKMQRGKMRLCKDCVLLSPGIQVKVLSEDQPESNPEGPCNEMLVY